MSKYSMQSTHCTMPFVLGIGISQPANPRDQSARSQWSYSILLDYHTPEFNVLFLLSLLLRTVHCFILLEILYHTETFKPNILQYTS